MAPNDIRVRRASELDYSKIEDLVSRLWGADFVVTKGNVHRIRDGSAMIAERQSEVVGLVTYNVENSELEILTLDALVPRIGIGTKLLDAVQEEARALHVQRVFAITSNDNLDALRFYQMRGFTLVAVHHGAITQARRIKPSIPLLGHYGVPIRDELELEWVWG